MMTLLVALDYKKVTLPGQEEMGEGKDDNAFRYFVSKLVSPPIVNRTSFQVPKTPSRLIADTIYQGYISDDSTEKKISHSSSRVSLGSWKSILK